MARNELLFDSERQARKAQRRQLLRPVLIAAVAVLLVVGAAALLLSGRAPVRTGGEDTPYPYTWQQQSDGSVRLELGYGDQSGCVWRLAEAAEVYDALTVTRSEAGSAKTIFTLTPTQAGRAIFTLLLAPEGSGEARYRIVFLAEAQAEGSKYAVEILSSDGAQLQGRASGAQDTPNPYEIAMNDDGDLRISVKADEEVLDWSFQPKQETEIVALLGMYYENGCVTVLLRAGSEQGSCEAELISQTLGFNLSLTIVNNGDGSILVNRHDAVVVPPVEEPEETLTETTDEP